jgi:hypothetical protein
MGRTKQKIPNKAAPTKYYRVVLEAIDPHRETKESFALKLSMQTHTPVTRINAIVKNMPCPVKTGLSMSQAKKFSTVLEEFGGIVTIVEYVVSAGDSDPELESRRMPNGQTGDHPIAPAVDQRLKGTGESIVCSNCGWENNGEVEFCAFCYAKFGDQPALRPLADRLPEENPLIEKREFEDEEEDVEVKKNLPLSTICILGGMVVVLIWIISRF